MAEENSFINFASIIQKLLLEESLLCNLRKERVLGRERRKREMEERVSLRHGHEDWDSVGF